MANYIDGFAFPIASDCIDQYKAVAQSVAEIYREYGALDYVEFVGDDMNRDGTRSFLDLANGEHETVVFGWIVFESREERDRINRKIEDDDRIEELVAPLLSPENKIFAPEKMLYGGFKQLV